MRRRLKKAITLAVLLLLTAMLGACTAYQTTEKNSDSFSQQQLKDEKIEQFKLSIRYQSELQSRLANVSFPLLKENVEQCGAKTRIQLGFTLHNPTEYKKLKKEAITQLFGAEDAVQILRITRSSPADNELAVGDTLLQINQQAIDQKPNIAIKQIRETLEKSPSVLLRIKRGDKEFDKEITGVKVCDYPVVLTPSDQVNGYADGSQIMITSGLMRFAESDEQLALIIAHELAHNTQRHVQTRLKRATLGGLVDIALIASGIPSPGFTAALAANIDNPHYETDADLQGLYLMHKSGFDISHAADFWRRMASLYPSMINHGKLFTHPTSAERYLNLKKYSDSLLRATP